MRSVPRCYKEDKFRTSRVEAGSNTSHRSPAGRRRRQKGSLESETVKYGRESQGTRT
jgi:hypothetical protein